MRSGAPGSRHAPNQMPVTGYLGKGLVNSYRGGDRHRHAHLAAFEGPAVHQLLDRGRNVSRETCINLLKDER